MIIHLFSHIHEITQFHCYSIPHFHHYCLPLCICSITLSLMFWHQKKILSRPSILISQIYRLFISALDVVWKYATVKLLLDNFQYRDFFQWICIAIYWSHHCELITHQWMAFLKADNTFLKADNEFNVKL